MDRKSFFRGFGIGVLFASVILGISFVIRTSDSFTKQRALELGMTYERSGESRTVLSDNEVEEVESAEELAESVDKKTGQDEDKQDKKSETSEQSESSEKKTSSEKSKKTTSTKKETDMKKEKEKLEKSVKAEQQKLIINAGEWSTTVSKKLQEMGIVKDAADFDKWLDKNGYSSSISAGTYNVSGSDTYRDLAEKITGKRK